MNGEMNKQRAETMEEKTQASRPSEVAFSSCLPWLDYNILKGKYGVLRWTGISDPSSEGGASSRSIVETCAEWSVTWSTLSACHVAHAPHPRSNALLLPGPC